MMFRKLYYIAIAACLAVVLLQPSMLLAGNAEECKQLTKTEDYTNALPTCQKAFDEERDAVSAYILGTLYYKGRGVSQDYKQSLKYFKIAAALGNPLGFYSVGVQYYVGHGVEENVDEAIKWFKDSHKAGYLSATEKLADIYARDKNDQNKANEYYRLAAINGSKNAQQQMANLYINDLFGKEKDLLRAYVWFKLAGVIDPDKNYKPKLSEAEYQKAQKIVANWKLGTAPDFDDKETEDYAILIARASNGDIDAQMRLGYLYSLGINLPESDKEEAIKWYKRAAAQGRTEALYKIGVNSDNTDEAFKWYLKAAEAGHVEAQMQVAKIYYSAGVPQEAKVTRSGDDKPSFSIPFTMKTSVKRDVKEALKWYRKAAEQGHPYGQVVIGSALITGEHGTIKKNEVQGAAWLLLAAEQGQEMAKLMVDKLPQKLNKDTITQAKALAEEYKKKYVKG